MSNEEQSANQNTRDNEAYFVSVINRLMLVILVLVIGIVSIPLVIIFSDQSPKDNKQSDGMSTTSSSVPSAGSQAAYWSPPEISAIQDTGLRRQVEYGRDLIAHTARYFGPKGSIAPISNGMNCQNCHLKAGTVVYGNNYGSVASLYPKIRARSGKMEDITKRVTDCFERSLNGQAPDSNSAEMNAIRSYIEYIGSNVPKGQKAAGSGFKDLAYLDRAADPVKGKQVYQSRCASCHQADGQGLSGGEEYGFPPLWGPHSYNDAAGLYRISNFAKYVKSNMPQGTTYDNPQLSDEEAWDVAAFVNSQERPHMNTPYDWPDISKKPVDLPFGPYADGFTVQQHKYGPFKPMAAAGKTAKKN